MVIKELRSELMADWFDFFDHRAFADHEEWNGCYCTAFFRPRPPEYSSPSRKRRDYARWLIETGRMKGYLAYEHGKVVAWVNTNSKTQFPRLAPLEDGAQDVLSIACFIVQKEYRGKGIAQKLLDRIIKDAKERGIRTIEAYPARRPKDEYGAWNGPYAMYERNGFADHRIDKTSVVRRAL